MTEKHIQILWNAEYNIFKMGILVFCESFQESLWTLEMVAENMKVETTTVQV